ncbi:hypothetical protein F4782DRAFT_546330 [Xylaria castorea]|nr:hypothetical protein F4782DRAFT_546330 [Xylaria castorea]
MTFNPLPFIKACFGACLSSRRSEPASPAHRTDHYNARLRANIGLIERSPERSAGSALNAAKSLRAQSGESQYTIGLPVTASTSHLRIKSQDRLSGTKPGMQWSTSYMSRAELAELFNLIQATLGHVPYAICGLAALIDHGLTNRQANRVSLICPQPCRKNVMAWAATKGYEVHAGSIGIPTGDGLVRRVRVKFVERGFEALQRVRSSCSNATVLSIASQLDNVAAGWLDNKRRGDERALRVIASDIFFCLDRIAARRERVDPKYLPTFLGEAFFADFSSRYMEARPGMARAGIDVSAVLAKHRTATSLREHDEMLRQYGSYGDTVPQEPRGQFEGLRTSVYTIREKDSPPEASVRRLPTMPQPPKQVYQLTNNKDYNPSRPSTRTDGPTLSTLGRSLAAQRHVQPKPVTKPDASWI